ncbi:Glutathione peroxidase 2 [Dimargaris verticillata]|uniref:Glutathione peroxidase n=1 Tax=Dimargaris verticillata TaxID=2761393 RepID=A0A9W8EB17_9FUNG|nr:Glutathione peroxidase 2 [Dimargaris verticillata]
MPFFMPSPPVALARLVAHRHLPRLCSAVRLPSAPHSTLRSLPYRPRVCVTPLTSAPSVAMSTAAKSFHDLNATTLEGEPYSFAQLKGKVVLVANVASKCGFTPQYKGLEELYQQFKDKDFVVLAFPCNQFGGQEPGGKEEIQACSLERFRTTFPMMEKVDVNGSNEHPVYAFLKEHSSRFLGMTRIKWNFEKFLVNRNGEVTKRYSSVTTPESIAADVEKLL